MSLFKNLASDDSIQNEVDTLGGGGAVESGLYDLKIKNAYVKMADSEAMSIVLVLVDPKTKKELRFQEYVTSGKEKGCKNYYEKNGEKHYLPGYNNINAVTLLTVGKELHEMQTEEKLVPQWDNVAKKEVPQKAQVLVDLVNEDITLGILQVLENKTKWNEATKKREVLPETRTVNQLDKVFRSTDHLTVAEVRARATEPKFYGQWGDKNTGNTRDKTTTPTAGASASNGAVAGKPVVSLFSPQ